ncbi:MAG: efflux RND transporter periplasmic adaptor subunit [Bacteroides sp.]|nr:efflux RND transporter periplasmic adaptor subunit [Bacteroides sp.]MCM1456232.1 efflux RND transporter periplasmic adaptor subunit [Lachnoclostridium sp.]
MKARYVLISAGAILVLAGCNDKDKEKSAQAGEPEPVAIAEVVADSVVIHKKFPATLKASDVVDLMARVNGALVSQNFSAGDKVKKGQVLFTIEDARYRDAVVQAESQLETAKSTYAYASKNYAALEKALESDAVAQIQVLDAKSAMEQARASVANATAALQSARTTLGYCTVRAPFDGDMSVGEYSEGAYIAGEGAAQKLATIYDNSVLNAEFYIDDASYLRSFTNENGRSKINYDSVPMMFEEKLPHNYYGKLVYIAPDVDTSTGTLHVRAKVKNPYGELRDGMYTTISLPMKLDPNAILVKDASISTDQLGKFVYVVNDSNRVVYTPIKVGAMANDSMRVVTSGLNRGDRYVTRALLKVRPGMEIKPVLTE